MPFCCLNISFAVLLLREREDERDRDTFLLCEKKFFVSKLSNKWQVTLSLVSWLLLGLMKRKMIDFWRDFQCWSCIWNFLVFIVVVKVISHSSFSSQKDRGEGAMIFHVFPVPIPIALPVLTSLTRLVHFLQLMNLPSYIM